MLTGATGAPAAELDRVTLNAAQPRVSSNTVFACKVRETVFSSSNWSKAHCAVLADHAIRNPLALASGQGMRVATLRFVDGATLHCSAWHWNFLWCHRVATCLLPAHAWGRAVSICQGEAPKAKLVDRSCAIRPNGGVGGAGGCISTGAAGSWPAG